LCIDGIKYIVQICYYTAGWPLSNTDANSLQIYGRQCYNGNTELWTVNPRCNVSYRKISVNSESNQEIHNVL